MLKTDELLNEAMSLPIELRAQLVDALLRSLNPAQAQIDELWAAEAERRIAEIDAGQVELLVMLDSNPVYAAPADLQFTQRS